MRARIDQRCIEVLIDESVFPDLGIVMAGAIVIEDDLSVLEDRVRLSYEDLSGLTHLKGEASFDKFVANGFHATDDLSEISTHFVKIMSEIAGTRLFIEVSDGSARRDISDIQRIGLLELKLVETILRKYRSYGHARFTFEQNQSLDRLYDTIVNVGSARAGYRGTSSAHIGTKMRPHSLSIVDYALVLFGRTQRPNAPNYEKRHWKAIAPMVSSIHVLDTGRLLDRRGGES